MQLTYKNVLVRIPEGIKGEYFERITNNRSTYEEKDKNSIRLLMMETILVIYQIINPIIMAISIACYLVLMVQFFRKKHRFQSYKQVILLNGLLCMYFVRIMTVAYVAATEYKSAIAKCQYLSNIYPVQSIFSIVSILFMIPIIDAHRKNKKQESEEK